nr:hypothetical protein [Streptomyces physcomitrii]
MPRRPADRRAVKPRPNPLDQAGITYIDYKDTDLLRRFLGDRGKILPQPSAGGDPRPAGHPHLRPAAAADDPRHQERPGDGPAAVRRLVLSE